ncbi:hypothetical protein J4733_26265 [Klebsiella pneumoniae]|uniref:Sulfatase N-terminal domain-containing protein n=1 Tax=Klebsiella pneumoniae TaxID=573 RepID=A0A939SVC7_KLEPN|nr:hypothetical protein [Klebsiella pneumoniae]
MKTGITFTNHQNTANVCTPSRSVMYTGLHMPHTGCLIILASTDELRSGPGITYRGPYDA